MPAIKVRQTSTMPEFIRPQHPLLVSRGPRGRRAQPYPLRCAHRWQWREEIEGSGRKMQLEGTVTKRATSLYREGKRTDDWQKVKFAKSETFRARSLLIRLPKCRLKWRVFLFAPYHGIGR